MALPGVSTIIRDKFSGLSRTNAPVGPKVAIIGTRTTANATGGVQDLDPYNAAVEKDVITAFGEGSMLHRGYLEAQAGGAQNIILVPMPSDTVFDHNNAELTSASHTAIDSGADLFDDAFAAAEAARVDIIVPWGRGIAYEEYEDPATPSNDPELGFHADNDALSANSWLSRIANTCATITTNSHPCFAILGVKPFGANPSQGATPIPETGSFESMTPGQINTHLQLASLIDRENVGLGDNGFYVSVVAAEARPLGYPADFGYSNGAAIYAGHIVQLRSYSAPTAKTVYNVESFRYNPVKTTQESLIGKGVVPVALDFNSIPRWVDSPTFAQADSDYRRLSTVRIVFDSVLMARTVAQQFIGEAATNANKAAFETALTAGLKGMQEEGSLYSSDFTVTYNNAENSAVVDMVLNPALELRNIEIRVAIQF